MSYHNLAWFSLEILKSLKEDASYFSIFPVLVKIYGSSTMMLNTEIIFVGVNASIYDIKSK